MKFDVKSFALTSGLIWGAAIFLTTILSISTGYATAFLNGIGSIYPGYTISPIGSVIGFVYGFLDASIGVYIFVWVYKLMLK